jgi:hypothetical protein
MLKIKGRNIASSYLEIEPMTLIKTVPQKVSFNYKISESKKSFGCNGKILGDISELLSCSIVLQMIEVDIPWNKLIGKTITQSIADSITTLNSLKGKVTEIKTHFESDLEKLCEKYIELDKFIGKLSGIDSEQLETKVDCYLTVIQMLNLKNNLGEDFKKLLNMAFT